MPKRDGTGPMGTGMRMGRGLGLCTGACAANYGAGLGLACRRGFGHGRGTGAPGKETDSKTRAETLQKQRDALQHRLTVLERQLENL
ncbi:MAG: hypothetical protein EOM66_01035 [Clostridia bacterium]|nr:hypothetical protein [Clostridia bacterium]